MRRLAKAGLWLLAPAYVVWRESRLTVSRPQEPFRRWKPKAMRWEALFVVPGAVTVGFALMLGMPGLAIFGIVWALIGGLRLMARLIIPKRWVETETDFTAMTTAGIAIRAAFAVGLIASLALARWTLAVGFGMAEAALAISGVVGVYVLQRIVGGRRAAGS